MTPLLLTRAQAAELLGFTVKHFDRHVAQQLPRIYSGRLLRFRASDVSAWVDKQAGGVSNAPKVERSGSFGSQSTAALVISPQAAAMKARLLKPPRASTPMQSSATRRSA